MSNMNSSKEISMLPEDIEEKMGAIQEMIASLGRRKFDLEAAVTKNESALNVINQSIEAANVRLSIINSDCDERERKCVEREMKVSQKESAQDVYANALSEKEKKIAKYISFFENMKDVITK